MKTIYIVCIVLTAFSLACRKIKKQITLNDTDRNFLTLISHANRTQAELSQLTSTHAEDQLVRNLGQSMKLYSQTSQAELTRIASENQTSIPLRSNHSHNNIKNSFSQLSGRNFDSVYVCFQIRHHLGLINLLREELTNGK